MTSFLGIRSILLLSILISLVLKRDDIGRAIKIPAFTCKIMPSLEQYDHHYLPSGRLYYLTEHQENTTLICEENIRTISFFIALFVTMWFSRRFVNRFIEAIQYNDRREIFPLFTCLICYYFLFLCWNIC